MRKGTLRALLVLSLAGAASSGCVFPAEIDRAREQQSMNLIDRGVMYIRQGQLDQAQASFLVANELAPAAAALDGLGCVAFLKGDIVLAEQYFRRAYQMDQTYYEALANLALLKESQGLYSEARRAYQSAIRHNPADFRARNNLAGLLYELQDDKQAVRAELLKADALSEHPLVVSNLNQVEVP